MDSPLAVAIQRLVLAACGAASFVLGVTVRADRSSLAVALVGLGAALLLVAVLLPRIQSLDANVAGIGLSLHLADPVTGTSDERFRASVIGDLRGAAPIYSGAPDLERIINGPPLRYLVINLEGGRSWLTSRLYVFIALLRDHRELTSVVFTMTADDGNHNAYIGHASVCDVLACLDRAYPWLPIAYARSTSRFVPPGAPFDQLLENPPPRDPSVVFADFVAGLRDLHDAPFADDQFVRLDNATERARWIDFALLHRDLGAYLDRRRCIHAPEKELMVAIAEATAATIVVVTSGSGEVESVVDRLAMLDELAAAAAATSRAARAPAG